MLLKSQCLKSLKYSNCPSYNQMAKIMKLATKSKYYEFKHKL